MAQPATKGHGFIPGDRFPGGIGVPPSRFSRRVDLLDAFPPGVVPIATVVDEYLKLTIRDRVCGHPERLDLEDMINRLKCETTLRNLNPCNIRQTVLTQADTRPWIAELRELVTDQEALLGESVSLVSFSMSIRCGCSSLSS